MHIRKAELRDIGAIEKIYSEGRAFMRDTGNATQWGSVYPPHSLILEDIKEARLYVVTEENTPVAVFVFFVGSDPTYAKIYGGEWKNSEEYGVLHRVCVSSYVRGRGVVGVIFDHCRNVIGNLKIDTHRSNFPMQRALAKAGFEYCGIIRLENGDERIAYQYAK